MDLGVVLVDILLMMEATKESGKLTYRAMLELYGLELCMIMMGRPYGDASKVEQEDIKVIR